MSNQLQHTANDNRLNSLDALRGLAILLMVLSGVIARKVLPNWMYHAQVPPPEHLFNPNLPGFTWVDLVFPLFLFCMGAAFPMALNKYKENKLEGVKRIGLRFFNLTAFAILLQHVRPGHIGGLSESTTWMFALLGLVLLFLMYSKWPHSVNPTIQKGLKVAGWIGMVAMVFFLPYSKTNGFDLYRSDIILLILADMALFGGLIWLFTSKSSHNRYLILVIYAALRLSSTNEGWINGLWDFSPAPWLFKWDYLKYLFIVIPGMFAGEWLLKAKLEVVGPAIKSTKLTLVLLSIVSLTMTLFIGLQSREVFITTLISSVLGLIIYQLSLQIWKKGSALNQLIVTSIFWIVLGLLIEPYSGGIKKDPSSFTYWMITSGMSGLLLLGFYVLFDIRKQKKWSLLVQNGQNPMIAYVLFGDLIWPVLALSGFERFINTYTQTPFMGFLKGVIYTLLVAIITKYFTQKKIYWKT